MELEQLGLQVVPVPDGGSGYRTATGELIHLQPLPLTIEDDDGSPVVTMMGRADAAMATSRVVRAAQAFFELPSRNVSRTLKMGRTSISARALPDILPRKQISAFTDEDSQLLRILYREVVLRFKPKLSATLRKKILDAVGLQLRSTNKLIPDQVILYDAERQYTSEQLVQKALQLAELDEVAFATPNFVSQFRRYTGARPDRIATAQWHLRLVGALDAWKLTRGRRTVSIAILDDGIDIEHPELRGAILKNPDPDEVRDKFGRDFYLPDSDLDHFNPRPKRFRAPYGQMSGNDIHGTACAGVAVGRGPKALGLAPACRLLPVKVFHADDLASDAQVADAIRYASLFADVISCSWTGSKSPDIEFALRDALENGRKKRGAVVVCAAGNDGRTKVGFPASDPHAIAVGASTDKDVLADYSNRGAELCVVAPSSGDEGDRGIFTTDVSTPGRGFNTGIASEGGTDGLFTNDFGGTSSATPLVAGLCGLMLSLKPDLSPLEVRQLLIRGARKIGEAADYDGNGHSQAYGFGRIDAAATLTLTKAYKRTPKRPGTT